MRAKITILGNEDNEYYYVECREDCRDETDRSAYDAFVESGETITMGKVIVSELGSETKRMKLYSKDFVLPEWVKEFLPLVGGYDEDYIVDMMSRDAETILINAPVALIQMGISAQLDLLELLHSRGQLVEKANRKKRKQ